MRKKIIRVLREYIFYISILTAIVGLLLLLMGILWFWLTENVVDLGLGFFTETIQYLKDWNAYIFVLGLLIFVSGIWYLYSYFTKKTFVIEELTIKKRSEFLKKHNEIEDAVKHLPSKYKKMLDDKKNELGIK